MTFLSFLILTLATWRTTSLLVREDGPFLIFRKLRERAGIQHDENGDVFMVPDHFFAGLLSCMWCSSVWMAGVWFGLWIFLPKIVIGIATIFALSAGAILLEARREG